jgi:hypothetical protein
LQPHQLDLLRDAFAPRRFGEALRSGGTGADLVMGDLDASVERTIAEGPVG